ncbi:MAG: anti-sigma factor family protein [Candidatus Saccharicenans sp.]
MRCHQAQRLINELLDGELGAGDRRQLQAHLDSCAGCRELYQDLKAIKETVAPAAEIEPSKRIWPKLESRLRAEVIPGLQAESTRSSKAKPARGANRWFQLARPAFKAALAMFIFLIFIAGAFYLGRHYQKPGRPEVQLASGNPALKKIQEAEFYYRQAIQSLTEAVEESGNGLPPEMVEILQANLNLLDRTIDLCQQAVDEQPDNLQAREYLLSAYNSKASFLNGLLETKKSLTSPGLARL